MARSHWGSHGESPERVHWCLTVPNVRSGTRIIALYTTGNIIMTLTFDALTRVQDFFCHRLDPGQRRFSFCASGFHKNPGDRDA